MMAAGGNAGTMAEQPSLSFAGLLRQLRAEAKLTQEELAEAAGLSPRSVSDLERGINRTARKDTALLLAGALGLTGPAGELFVAAERGRAPAAPALAAIDGGPQQRAGDASPYRGLSAFEEQDAPFFFGREAHRPSAGPDGAAVDGRGPAGGVGSGEVVAAAGRDPAADPGGRAGRRTGAGVV